MEWQPIETAPKDGTPVLVFQPGDDAAVSAWWEPSIIGGSDRGGWTMCCAYNNEWHPPAPSHWMPLPDPPRAHAPTPPDTPEEGA